VSTLLNCILLAAAERDPNASQRPRLKLSNEWTELARATGAAPIHFINNIDDEEIPTIVPDFQYIEKGYV
jgi:histone-lysine N-methyltransferase SUV39H